MVLSSRQRRIFSPFQHTSPAKGWERPVQQAQQAGLCPPLLGPSICIKIPEHAPSEGEMFKQGAIFTYAAQIVRLEAAWGC